MSYRNSADEMSIQDQLNKMKEEIVKNNLTSTQKYDIKLARTIIGGVLALSISFGALGYACNHEDNTTKQNVAKMCPATAPVIAGGLREANQK